MSALVPQTAGRMHWNDASDAANTLDLQLINALPRTPAVSHEPGNILSETDQGNTWNTFGY